MASVIFDARHQGAAEPGEYDVAVVGAGPAGITVAQELEGTGLRVALLESGGEEFDSDTQLLYDGEVTGHEAVDLTAGRLRYLGGTSNHWGGHCLPLDEIDFARTPLSGLSGWPLSWADMKPHYERAHPYCDLGEFDYDLRSAVNAKPEDFLLLDHPEIESRIIRQSPPTNFGTKYRSALESSRDTHLWLWTNVTGIEITADGEAEVLVTRTLNGITRRLRSAYVVLACGAVENARLLMATNQRAAQSFGDEGGYLGRCYMDHPVGGAAFLWLSEAQPPKAYWSGMRQGKDGVPLHFVWRLRDEVLEQERLANAQFSLIPFEPGDLRRRVREANRGWAALKSIAKWTLGRASHRFELSDEYCRAINSADAMALSALGLIEQSSTVRRLLLRYEAEQQPDRASYVFLSETLDRLGQPSAGLHWSPTEDDRDSILATAIRIGQICGAEGLGRIELEEHFDARYWNASTAWHQLGTTRMSVSPRHGVVDSDCRLHGSRNVYVAGGSIMPSGGRANPTLTIVALSIRLADHIKRRVAS